MKLRLFTNKRTDVGSVAEELVDRLNLSLDYCDGNYVLYDDKPDVGEIHIHFTESVVCTPKPIEPSSFVVDFPSTCIDVTDMATDEIVQFIVTRIQAGTLTNWPFWVSIRNVIPIVNQEKDIYIDKSKLSNKCFNFDKYGEHYLLKSDAALALRYARAGYSHFPSESVPTVVTDFTLENYFDYNWWFDEVPDTEGTRYTQFVVTQYWETQKDNDLDELYIELQQICDVTEHLEALGYGR